MAETLPLDKLTKNTRTLFEAVEVVAKRARHINEVRRAHIEILDTNEEQTEEGFEETVIEVPEQVFEKKIKPTKQAIDELMTGDLEISYPLPEEE